MLRGQVVESGPVKELFAHPKHPYTKGLLMCRPALYAKGQRLPVVADFLSPLKEAIKIESSEGKNQNDLSESADRDILIKIRGVQVRYTSGHNWLGRSEPGIDAISDIHFNVYRGETLGLVGESGSGKTTLGRALLGLNKPVKGSIEYDGVDLLKLSKNELFNYRQNIQIVFQDPYSSLNPRLKIGPAIAEPVKVHRHSGKEERREEVLRLMHQVDLKPEFFDRYPHAFSGGQRQRIVIARALILHPGFVVFDESVSALDVSVQAQVLNLINDLKRSLGFTAVFISHDLSVIKYLCDRVLVMEKGRIVETGNAETIYKNPQTAYTRSLIESIPGNSLINST
jgi:peptide/nickel transport system ATP-binding protein